MTTYIAVCGGSTADDDALEAAEEVGRLVAQAGAVLITGGLGGVMAAAAKGATKEGGTAIGVLPSNNPQDGNEHNTVVVATGLGETRNTVIVNACDALIAIGGEFGTLSEIAFALRIGVPVIGYETWELARGDLDIPIQRATSPADAVQRALRAAER
jgi:uncharacterized protein (TIGR00725 family)